MKENLMREKKKQFSISLLNYFVYLKKLKFFLNIK
jgi:hypothetical protein